MSGMQFRVSGPPRLVRQELTGRLHPRLRSLLIAGLASRPGFHPLPLSRRCPLRPDLTCAYYVCSTTCFVHNLLI